MKFTIIKSCLARFSGIFALGTPSNIHGTAISYRCAKFGAFVNSVMILTLRDLTKTKIDSAGFYPIHRDKVEFSFGGVVSLRNLGLTSHNNTKRCSDLRLP